MRNNNINLKPTIEELDLELMKSFEFYIGGYFGGGHNIYIEVNDNERKFLYGKSNYGAVIDLKNIIRKNSYISDLIFEDEIDIKDILISEVNWRIFLNSLKEIDIINWKDDYYDDDICDGSQWSVDINFLNNRCIHKCGSNRYPMYWDKFLKVFEEVFSVPIITQFNEY